MLEYLELLAKLTQTPLTELTAQLTTTAEDGSPQLKSKEEVDTALNAAFQTRFQTVADEQRKRGIREASEKLERDIRERFELTTQAKGVDLVAEAVANAKASETEGVDPATLTSDQVAKLPAFEKLLGERVSTLKASASDWESKYNTLQGEREISQKQDIVRSQLMGLNPVLSSTAKVAGRQVDAYLNGLDYDRLKLTADGKSLVPIDESGHALENEMFQPVTLERHVRDTAFFDFHDQDPSKGSPSPSNGSQPPPQPGAGSRGSGKLGEVPKFKTVSELESWIATTDATPETQSAALEAFEAAQ